MRRAQTFFLLLLWALLSMAAADAGAQQHRSAADLQKAAQEASEQGDWAGAAAALEEAVKLRPRDVSVRLALMAVYRSAGRPDDEMRLGREILSLDPGCAEAMRRLAQLAAERGKPALEEEMRRALAGAAPGDRENLVRLADLMAAEGRTREEILACESLAGRFDRAGDMKRLAELYGREGDRYRQLMTWRRVLRLEPRNHEVKGDYRRVCTGYRKEQGLYDELSVDALTQTQDTPYNLLFENSVAASYRRPFLFEGGAVGLDLQFRSRNYMAKAGTEQSGEVKVASAYYGLMWESTWKGEKNRLTLRGGLLTVEASSPISPSPGFAVSPTQFPWTENRPFGGGALLYDGEYAAHLSRGFLGRLYFRRNVVDDLDAYARVITKDVWGTGFSYETTDHIAFDASVDWSHLSDHNNLQYVKARFEYPLWSAGSLYDLEHTRTGYLRQVPDSSLKVGYEVEYINHEFVSPYYVSYLREWQNRLLASGSYRVGKNLYFKAGAAVSRGQALEFDREYRAGIMYAETGGRNTVDVSYVLRETRMGPGAQVNRTYEGDGSFRGLQVKGSWRF